VVKNEKDIRWLLTSEKSAEEPIVTKRVSAG
jgi:hypothetical protein